jgi:hypothetical protein
VLAVPVQQAHLSTGAGAQVLLAGSGHSVRHVPVLQYLPLVGYRYCTRHAEIFCDHRKVNDAPNRPDMLVHINSRSVAMEVGIR